MSRRKRDRAICPSDPDADDLTSPPDGGGIAATSYAGNFGGGLQRYGFNGLFQYIGTKRFGAGSVRASDAIDGLSQTAAIAEIRVGNCRYETLRTVWDTPYSLSAPDELDEFPNRPAATCMRGRRWTNGNLGSTLYNHILTPNQRSCWNGGNIQTAA